MHPDTRLAEFNGELRQRPGGSRQRPGGVEAKAWRVRGKGLVGSRQRPVRPRFLAVKASMRFLVVFAVCRALGDQSEHAFCPLIHEVRIQGFKLASRMTTSFKRNM